MVRRENMFDESTNESQPLLSRTRLNRRWRIGARMLLVSQFFERMGYYGLTANFIFFLNGDPFSWATYNAATLVLVFNTIVSFCSVLGAWLADAYLGKFKVMVIGYLLYILFYLPIPFMYFETWNGSRQNETPSFCLVTREWDNMSHFEPGSRGYSSWMRTSDRFYWEERCSVVISLCMILVAVGVSFIKAVITPFGAEQVQQANEDAMRSFFNWYYWIINSGTFIAYAALAAIQVNVSLFWGYMGSCIMIIISFCVFVAAKPFLRDSNISESIAGKFIGIISYGCCCKCHRNQSSLDSSVQYIHQRHTQEDSVELHPSCLNRSKISRGGRYDSETVENVKKFLHIMLVFSCFVFYWTCYLQIQTLFLSEGLHMKVGFFDASMKTSMPVAWLSLVDIVVIVLLIPFLDSVVYPWFSSHGIAPSLYTRIFIGMLFSTGAMVTAGVIERIRMQTFWGYGNPSATKPWGWYNQTIGGTTYIASNMSVFYQIPQYTLLGIGEAFAAVAGLEFAYTMAPRSMESLVTGFYWFVSGVGSLLGVLLVQSLQNSLLFSNDVFDINYREPCVVNGTVTDRWCRETRLDIYFFILAGLQTVGVVLFVVVVSWILPRCGSRMNTKLQQQQQEDCPVIPVVGDIDVIHESDESMMTSTGSIPVRTVSQSLPAFIPRSA